MDTAHSPLNVLIVEDNDNLRESIVDALSVRGYHVLGIDCAEALPEQTNLELLDLAILDLNLPGEDGLSLAKRLRETHPDLGIIMLTARTQPEERVAGYVRGADIYLTKPASLDELVAAMIALTRRLKQENDSRNKKTFQIKPRQRTLITPAGNTVSLTEHESALLVAFSRAHQKKLANWQIAEIFGMDGEHINKSAIELHIVRLRKKLQQPRTDEPTVLVVRGHGYQLCIDIVLS